MYEGRRVIGLVPVLDEEQKITRPKQLYLGYDERPYVPLDQRRDGGALETEVSGPL